MRFALRRAGELVVAWHLEAVGADELAQRAITALLERSGAPAPAAPILRPESWLRHTIRVQALRLLRDAKTRRTHARDAAYVRSWRRSHAPRGRAEHDGPGHPAAWNTLSPADLSLVELFAGAKDFNLVAEELRWESWRVQARLKWIAWRLEWESHGTPLPGPRRLLRLLRADDFTIEECAIALDVTRACIEKRISRGLDP
jgi:DNA-directed RNA polymerase specialized sigma24 family protein